MREKGIQEIIRGREAQNGQEMKPKKGWPPSPLPMTLPHKIFFKKVPDVKFVVMPAFLSIVFI